jgi:hypothetical protein
MDISLRKGTTVLSNFTDPFERKLCDKITIEINASPGRIPEDPKALIRASLRFNSKMTWGNHVITENDLDAMLVKIEEFLRSLDNRG